MKKSVTFRLDAELLADARHRAGLENRTLTNFIETVLKQHIATAAQSATNFVQSSSLSRPTANGALERSKV